MSKNKELACINILQGSLLLVIIATCFTNPSLFVKLAALAGTLNLAVLLIAPRFLKWRLFKRWHAELLVIARNSKWMGIWTALWFLLHTVSGFVVHLHFSWLHLLQPAIMSGLLALGVFCVMLALSNSWSYQHVKWWKHLNMAVWLVAPLGLAHALLAAASYMQSLPLPTALVLFPAITLVGLLATFESTPGYFTPHRLGLLLGGSALGMLSVVWYLAL